MNILCLNKMCIPFYFQSKYINLKDFNIWDSTRAIQSILNKFKIGFRFEFLSIWFGSQFILVLVKISIKNNYDIKQGWQHP